MNLQENEKKEKAINGDKREFFPRGDQLEEALLHIPSPGRIWGQHFGVSHHNQQGFSPGHGHVESLHVS